MPKKTIVTCAVTGNITTLAQHPNLPITPKQIADASIGAARAGAAIAHIHVREPDSGRPSMRLDLYREVVERIRESREDLIVNLTTGPGGRFRPTESDPRVAGEGTTLTTPERRVAHVVELRPEMCSLDFDTMVFGSDVVINTPRSVRAMAQAIDAAGVKPELEVFDAGHIVLANDVIGDGLLRPPHFFQIVLGVKYGAPATTEALLHLRSMLPGGCEWAAFGIGRMEFPIVAQSFVLGGHVRVGFEDNLYISKGELARDNAQLVERAVRIVRDLGGDCATPEEARTILGLRRDEASRSAHAVINTN
jgi:uncharacterized protein (DUF849 family)